MIARGIVGLMTATAMSCASPPPPLPPAPPPAPYRIPVPTFEVAVLVDQSGSMLRTDPGQRRRDAAALLLQSLAALDAQPGCPNRAAVIHFANHVCGEGAPQGCGALRDLTDTAATRAEARRLAAARVPVLTDNTNIAEALSRARDVFRGAARGCAPSPRRRVILLTDGLPDPDGRSRGEALRREFNRIRSIWLDPVFAGAKLHLLALDADGTTFTPAILADWQRVGRSAEDIENAPVTEADAMLAESARIIADLSDVSGARGEPSEPLTMGDAFTLEPWRARLELWVLGTSLPSVPSVVRPGGVPLQPSLPVARGDQFLRVRVDDPPSGAWSVEPMAGARILVRHTPYTLRLAAPRTVAQGDERPLVAHFQRPDGSPVRGEGQSRVPFSFRTIVHAPGGAAPIDLGFRDAGAGSYVTEHPVHFDRLGPWTVDLTTLSEGGAGQGHAVRWTTTDTIQVQSRPRIALARPTARTWGWPFRCSVTIEARIVNGTEQTLSARELADLGSPANLVLLEGGSYLAYDPVRGLFHTEVACPPSRSGEVTASLALMTSSRTARDFDPERYAVGVRVETSWWYWAFVACATLAAAYATAVGLRYLYIRSRRVGAPGSVKYANGGNDNIANVKPAESTEIKATGKWFTLQMERGSNKNTVAVVYLGSRMRLLLGLWRGKSLRLDSVHAGGTLGDVKFTRTK